MANVSNTDDIIDIRDVIARVEELREARDEYDEFHNTPGAWANIDDGEPEELRVLEALLEECKGNGGDENWRGNWYPSTLIRDTYFQDYAQELAEEVADPAFRPVWPYTCIDWEHAASELQRDYAAIDFDGVTYYYR